MVGIVSINHYNRNIINYSFFQFRFHNFKSAKVHLTDSSDTANQPKKFTLRIIPLDCWGGPLWLVSFARRFKSQSFIYLHFFYHPPDSNILSNINNTSRLSAKRSRANSTVLFTDITTPSMTGNFSCFSTCSIHDTFNSSNNLFCSLPSLPHLKRR